MLTALVDFSFRKRRWVLGSWVAAAVLGLVLGPAVSEFNVQKGAS